MAERSASFDAPVKALLLANIFGCALHINEQRNKYSRPEC